MLTRARIGLTLLVASLGLVVGIPAAQADPPVCTSFGPAGECLVWAAGGTGGGGGGGGGGGDTVHTITINGTQCYPGGLANPQPPKTEAVWGGHTTGAIFDCVVPPRIGPRLLIAGWTIQYWAESAPPATPNPAVLVRQAAVMQLRAITIGIVPESKPSSVGLVGMPNWMWVEQPSKTTWGPSTISAGTVRAEASVKTVTWDMGDGSPVVNCGLGTPYQDFHGKKTSPDCGHVYTRTGKYTVRATSHWVIDWSGIGQRGTITMDLTQEAPVTIGEVQVLNQ